MRKVLYRAATGAIAVLTVMGAGTAAAHADNAYTCDSGEFCLWENQDYNSGTHSSTYGIYEWESSDDSFANNHWRDLYGNDGTDVLDNEASSARNRTGCTVVLYQDKYYGGDKTAFGPGDKSGDLSKLKIDDNRASSVKFDC